MDIKVSVVVPAYNVEKYIKETLDCLIEQSLKEIQVIVVNDGSTDSTQEIINEYCKEHDNFISIKKENGGVSSARNVGLSYVTGKYVLFLDSDDTLTAESLEAFYNTLEKTGADVAIGRIRLFGSSAESYNEYADALAKQEKIYTFDKAMLWNFLVGNKCYRTDFLKACGAEFPKLRYSEEGVFFFNSVYAGAKLAGTYDACMNYRRHDASKDASVTQRVSIELVKDFITSLSVIYDMAESSLEHFDIDEETSRDYLEEITYKTDLTLLTQFLRLAWQTDENTLQYIGEEHKRLYEKLGDASREKINKNCSDLSMFFSFDEIAENPKISVLLKADGDLEETIASLYLQTMPEFEVIIPKSVQQKVPVKWRVCGNLKVIEDKCFFSQARKEAKGKYIIKIKRGITADLRLFRFLVNLPVPEFIKKMFFNLLFKIGLLILNKG